ncbi:MAG: hypothetical protein KAH32_01325 [Chlamydiia bacterium]|nr:hypothetical protein [Chlamydiia bacterium]
MTMNNIKLTKSELKKSKESLSKLSKYLPIMKIKKQMLAAYLISVKQDLAKAEKELQINVEKLKRYRSVFCSQTGNEIIKNVLNGKVISDSLNVAGCIINLPMNVTFRILEFCEYTSPWDFREAYEAACGFGKSVGFYRGLLESVNSVERELRKASVRSSLFENILIPRCNGSIRKISSFLEDQAIIALGQAKSIKKKQIQREQLT